MMTATLFTAEVFRSARCILERFRWWFIVVWLVTILFSVLLTGLVVQSNRVTPMVTAVIAYPVTGVVGEDGDLAIYYELVRNKVCQTDQLRFLYNWVDFQGRRIENVVTIDAANVPLLDPEPGVINRLIVHYQVPKKVYDGKWFFVSKSLNWCNIINPWGPVISETPHMPITVARGSSNE